MRKKIAFILLSFVLGLFFSACTTQKIFDLDHHDRELLSIVQELAHLIGKDITDVHSTIFEWNTDYSYTISIGGYTVQNSNYTEEPFLTLATYFQDWETDVNNAADGALASILGYKKGDIFCLAKFNINGTWEEIMDVENHSGDFDFMLELSCGRDVGNVGIGDVGLGDEGDDSLKFITYGVSGFGSEPFWGFSIHDDTFYFDSPKINKEIAIIAHIEGEEIIFQGDGVFGTLIEDLCVDDGIGDNHTHQVIIDMDGMEYRGCADIKEFYAFGDDFFKLEKMGPISEFLERTHYNINLTPDEIIKATYSINDIYQSYILVGLFVIDSLYSVVLEYDVVAGEWRVIREGQDIDYDSCQNIMMNYPNLLNWSIFQYCLDPELTVG